MHMQEHAIKLPLEFDVARLVADLHRSLEHGTVRQFGNYHDGSWTGISLRSEGGRALTTHTGLVPTGEPFDDSPVLAETPYFRQVLARIPCPKRAVRLLHLPSGAKIEPHVDPPLTFQHGILRLHIPVVTHPDVEFVIGGLRCDWRAGELWWGNFSLLHHVYNNSPINRVHLVMDVEITPAALELFPPEFVAEQRNHGILLHKQGLQLTESELDRFECTLQIPPEVFPHEELRSGGAVRVRSIEGQLVVSASPSPPTAPPILRLTPIAPNQFAIVGWSQAVTLHFSVAEAGVTTATLVVCGLSKRFMQADSDENPRVARKEITLETISEPAAFNGDR